MAWHGLKKIKEFRARISASKEGGNLDDSQFGEPQNQNGSV